MAAANINSNIVFINKFFNFILKGSANKEDSPPPLPERTPESFVVAHESGKRFHS